MASLLISGGGKDLAFPVANSNTPSLIRITKISTPTVAIDGEAPNK
jgi:hypothetical protein